MGRQNSDSPCTLVQTIHMRTKCIYAIGIQKKGLLNFSNQAAKQGIALPAAPQSWTDQRRIAPPQLFHNFFISRRGKLSILFRQRIGHLFQTFARHDAPGRRWRPHCHQSRPHAGTRMGRQHRGARKAHAAGQNIVLSKIALVPIRFAHRKGLFHHRSIDGFHIQRLSNHHIPRNTDIADHQAACIQGALVDELTGFGQRKGHRGRRAHRTAQYLSRVGM